MMRKVSLLLVLCMLPLFTWAQTKVNATDIIAKINRGEAVSYENAEIVGDLDMTRLQNMKLAKGGNSKYDSEEYVSTVTAPISFINCKFTGNVLGYFNPDNGVKMTKRQNKVYNTNFEESVLFESCTFERETAFKYSHFEEEVSFVSSRFAEEALFKYADFEEDVNFSNVRFNRDANFKYVEFPEQASFAGATFIGEANFKYAKFEHGVSFEKALFDGAANFKYAKASGSFNVAGASFKGDNDFKYTELNNRKVTLASLQSMHR
ncbi:pentapeptide repeat-containing protein [Pontibacter mangrovi]|uniref:Pentapeptide repeat-containing protein n=1 Tax=Pontibacter mangrovi TaxID=2589816 RepID=A0A501W8E4_9BACT|nr:pentapeptide repeat-containing protein [Pontibacter mangrovi]TPE45002.1 hypothetical protein FJM65_08300 [Pontibacter mangrovi]